MTDFRPILAALPDRRAWIVGLANQRDQEVERGNPAAAELWAHLSAELANIDDDERSSLRALDFAPGVTVGESEWLPMEPPC